MIEQGRKDWAAFTRTSAQTKRARILGRDATSAERILWTKLNRSQLDGLKFRRQHPVGPYVLDFYCPAAKLCIELDGDQHGHDREMAHDARRTAYLDRRGIEVLRFWNWDVTKNLVGVVDAILHRAMELSAYHERGSVPFPRKREGNLVARTGDVDD